MSGSVELCQWPNAIVFERGGLQRLGEFAQRLGCGRAFVLCGSTIASGVILERVRVGLGSRLAGVFTGVKAHTPMPIVREAAAAAIASGADLLVSVGGGSATDTGKAVAMLLASGGAYEPYRLKLEDGHLARRPSLPDGVPPHIAVPTVPGSGSEILPSAGILDPVTCTKMRFSDPALLPKLAILDAEIVALCGRELTVSTGLAILARCVETLYSLDRNPISAALAAHALRLQIHALSASIEDPGALDARADCQYAAIMSTLAATHAEVSVVHALGSAIGGRCLLPHGLAHGLLVAPVLRDLMPATEEAGSHLNYALGLDQGAGADEAATALAGFVTGLGIGPRLRDIGVPEADLPDIAASAARHSLMVKAPRPVSLQELHHWLREVW